MTNPTSSHYSLPELRGRPIIITGASSGIGAALVRAFAAQGARVAIHYNSGADAAQALADEVQGAGGEAICIGADLSSEAGARRLIDVAADQLGGIAGLINNAGNMFDRVHIADLTDEHYDRLMDVNCRSAVMASRFAIPHLKAAGGGFIINTASIAARNGASSGAGLYAASKAFISTLTRGLAKELIPFDIRVNAVAPGVIATRIHDLYSSPEQMEGMLRGIPQGRLGTPEDCCGAYLFLACKSLSGYIVGQTIEVNGGMLMP